MSESSQNQAPQQPEAKPSGAFLWLLLLPIVGATLALILTDIHARNQLGSLSSGSLCGPVDSCNLIAVGPYSDFVGIPVAVWGLAFYLFVLALGLGARHELTSTARLGRWLRRLCVLALLIDGALAFIMIGLEGALCLYCVATYGVNIVLLVASSFLVSAAEPESRPLDEPVLLASGALAGVVLMAGLGLNHYLDLATKARLQSLLANLPDPQAMPREGGISLGSEKAPVEVVLFHDYRCLHCSRLRRSLRLIQRLEPQRLRLRLFNLPLDKACNERAAQKTGACLLARGALFAARQGKLGGFLSLMDSRRVRSHEELRRVLYALDLNGAQFDDPELQETLSTALGEEIKEGHRLGVSKLPTYFINGYRFEGALGVPDLQALMALIRRHSPSKRAR